MQRSMSSILMNSAPAGPDACGVQINRPGGIFNYWGLVEGGFLKADGNPAAGIDYVYDSCSQTVCAFL